MNFRNNPDYSGFRQAGIGLVTSPGCIQCQHPTGEFFRKGKAASGSLRGLAGILCVPCADENARKAAERRAARVAA